MAKTVLTNSSEKKEECIKAFYVKDNGIGFNKNNFDSFCTAESTYKFKKGGKGVGRFFWLKAFDKVEIESIYADNGSKILRHFDFSKFKNKEIIPRDDDNKVIPNGASLGTTVRLTGFGQEEV